MGPGLLLVLAGCSDDPGASRAGPGADGGDSSGSSGAEARPKNFLLFVSDDQGRALGCYGDDAPTPHIDALAAQGCRFTNAYTPVAVCMPSRAVIYTGRLPHSNGAMGFQPVHDDVPVWGDLLKQAGVYTGVIGKLNVKPRKRFDFDYMQLTGPKDREAWKVEWYVEGLRQFLKQRGDQPFAMIVNFRDPHRPFPSDGAPTGWPGDMAEVRDPGQVRIPATLVDTPAVRADLAQFHDAIRRMDVTLGAMLDVLAEESEADQTLVGFTSDNGEPFPFSKTTLYESGIHMPLIFRWPGVVPAGRVEDGFVSFMDFLPTVLDMAQAPVESFAGMGGRSLLPLLRDPAVGGTHTEIIGSHTDHLHEPAVPARSIRIGEWKYIKNLRPGNRFENDDMIRSGTWRSMLEVAAKDEAVAARVASLRYRPSEELFDLSVDPREMDNLAKAEPERVEQMRARLGELLAAQGDPLLDEFLRE
ncbi:MAG: N-sulfoglucosamine sulfohydrolase [Planctomycetota bacterium]|jgi:N-sulfoglucosamine sulfohydrolase